MVGALLLGSIGFPCHGKRKTCQNGKGREPPAMFFLMVGEPEHGFSHIDLPLGSTPSAQGSACLGSGQSVSSASSVRMPAQHPAPYHFP